MAQETEDERLGRIRDAQISARQGGTVHRTQQNSSHSKKRSVSQPKNNRTGLNRSNSLSNALHDILIGLGIGTIPCLLAVIFLPGGFKLIGLLLLLGGGVVGYMLGETVA